MKRRKTVLVVDDEAAVREVLEMRLEAWGFKVLLAESGERARALVARHSPHIVISDVVLPDASGLDLLPAFQGGKEPPQVILITAYGTIDTAVEAMKRGASDFLTKPIDYDKLETLLQATERRLERSRQTRRIEDRLEDGAGLGRLIGVSKPMRKVSELLRVVAASDASALLTGESGTGKEVAARTLHELSDRARGPFIAVNAAAVPENLAESEFFGHQTGAFTGAVSSRPGCFELADGGTLFLDEIAEMSLSLQPKFLRVLEDRSVRRLGGRRSLKVDTRVLAATNQDPEAAVAGGKLRKDLYYRLNVFTVELPPLRRRLGDVPLLVQHFIRTFSAKHGLGVEGISDEALATLRSYRWPGNVRELRNVTERAVILAREGWIEPLHLPPYLAPGHAEPEEMIRLPSEVTAQEAEKILILETLKRLGNNKSRAARQLGLDVKTIRNKLKAYAAAGSE